MPSSITVMCDGDWGEPEVQISGSSKALSEFALLIGQINEDVMINTADMRSNSYPVCLSKICLKVSKVGNDKLDVTVYNNVLSISGTNVSFQKLSQSLILFFGSDTSAGEHFHIDYYDGNEMLNETNCHLIFVCV